LEHQDFEVRLSAAEALANLESEQAIPALLQALEHQDFEVRKRAVKALGGLRSEQAVPALLKGLKDQDSMVRRTAVEALGKLKSEQAVPALLKGLKDQNSQVRLSAVEALGRLRSEQAIPALLNALEEQDFQVRLSAAEALGNLKSEQAIPALLKALEHQTHFEVRGKAAEALGKLKSKQAIPALLKALEAQDPMVVWEAARTLEDLNSEEAALAMSKALEYDTSYRRNSYVRGKAAEALGNLNSEEAIPTLLKALEDKHDVVRGKAAEALGNLNSEEAIPALLKALEDKHDVVRRAASEALGNLRSEQVIPILLKALEHQNYEVRRGGIRALGKNLSQPDVTPLNKAYKISILMDLLKSKNPEVCNIAPDALSKIGSPQPLAILWKTQFSSTSLMYYSSIRFIQSRCKYYNHELEEERKTIATPTTSETKHRTLLILASSPTDRAKLRLDREVRDINESLRRSQQRDRFTIQQKWAARPSDFRRALLDHTPQILHFCGHGEGEPGIIVENEAGKSQLVATEAIAHLFKLFADKGLECVVLNACYSEVQANAIAQHIPYVIGMSAAILDRTALKFSVGFYDALGAGWSYEEAFEMGKSAIATEGIPEAHLPVLKQQPSPHTG
jgi:HEAT repeat protein